MKLNSHGSAIVAMTFLTALLVLICSIAFWFLFFVKTKEKINHSCRNQVLKSQRNLLLYGERIIKLNPIASYLRKQRKVAKVLMAAELTLPMGLALYRATIRMQKALRSTQGMLFKAGETMASVNLMQHKMLMGKIATAKSSQPFWKVTFFSSKRSPVKIRLIKKNREIAPTYKWHADLEKKQSIFIKWSLRYKKSIFFQKVLSDEESIRWKGQCFARPKRRRNQWISILGRAR